MAARIAMSDDALARDLLEELQSIPVLDAHEHLVPEAEALQKSADFYTLFEHYCPGDFVAAGAGEREMALFADRRMPEAERWAAFRPYLSRVRTGSYARAALLVVRDLLGLPDLNDETYKEVGPRLRAQRHPGFYDVVLRQRCNIAACIQCVEVRDLGPSYFYHLGPSHVLVDLNSRADIEKMSVRLGRDVGGLNDALECMDKVLAEWAAHPRIVGIKSGQAYRRSLAFQKPERSAAEKALRNLLADRAGWQSDDTLPLQDFLMFELAARAGAVGLPIAIHTGLQAGSYNTIRNADPLLLQGLISQNRGTRFDLFHGGMPWVRQIAVLAKYFPNVCLNMAWMHIISPSQARSALAEWLDMVPNTKIFGFGGDYSIVEKVYGHLQIARENIAAVLAAKVREGAWTRADASLVARRLMRDNPAEFYGIEVG